MAKKTTTKKKATKKTAYQLTCQLYTMREHMQKPAQMARTLKRIRKIGYRNVQISGIGPVDPCDLKKMIDDAGLKAVGHHTNLNALRTDMVGLIDQLHCWDCNYTALASMPADERKTGAAWKKRAQEMTRFGKELAREGITLQYHNHAFEMHKFKVGKQVKTGLEILYSESDPKYLQAEIDTYWIAHGLGDPAAWCLKMKKRLDQVHLKDGVFNADENRPVFAEVGDGNLNWEAILKACKAARTKHYIVEQDGRWAGNNAFKALEISYNNLAKMGLK